MWERVSQVVWRVHLSDAAFTARHRVLKVILWLHVPLLVMVALLPGHSDVHAHVTAGVGGGRDLLGNGLVWGMILAVAVCAALSSVVRSRRAGAVVVSTGLLLASAALVHAGGGLTDLHFHFFFVLGLVSLYQDWLPFLVAVGLVAAHHVIMGLLAPTMLYSDPRAQAHPWLWGLMHAGFVLAVCAVHVAYWRFARAAQQETDNVRAIAETTLRRSEERFRALVQDSCDVIVVIGREGAIASVSPSAESVTGYRPEELVGTSYQKLIHPDDLAGILAVRSGSRPQHRVEVRVKHADKSWHWHDVTLRDLTDHPAIEGIVVHHRDISDRRAFQERLAHQAAHDGLTGLANRAAFIAATQQTLAAASRENRLAAVLFLDLDCFKQINDTLGHEAGDAVLVAVAEKLRRCVLGSDIVARLGGDEFAITLSSIHSAENAVVVAERILAELAIPSLIRGKPVHSGGSIGIAISEPGSTDTDRLIHRADIAMYRAKGEGDTGWQLYVEGMRGHHLGDSTLEDDLHRAVTDQQLRLQFQPIVDLSTSSITGIEALVRWQHPTRGLLAPLTFLPLAEQIGLIRQIEDWVLENACVQVSQWQQRIPDGRGLSLSVNVSSRQLDRHTFARDVTEILARTGFNPRDLILEFTESALSDDDSATSQLISLNASGVRIAVDDFGAGRSSLENLGHLPVDILKLDRRFVSCLDGTPAGSTVATAAIRLGAVLNLDVVAKGVETAAQADELMLLSCLSAQGHHFARPLDADALDTLVDRLTNPPANGAAIRRSLTGAGEALV